jgi:drug/metabolite transporter (DMT)-like permease
VYRNIAYQTIAESSLPQSHPKNASRGYFIALTATVTWSFSGVIISYLSRTYALPSLVMAFWRDLSASLALGLFLLLFQRARLRLPRVHIGFTILFAFFLAIFNSSWTFSVQFNGAAVATVLAFSSPAFTAVLSHWILKEQITRIKLLSIALSIIGIVLVANALAPSAWQANPAGIVFGLFTGLVFAVYNLMGKTASNRGINSWTTLLYSFSGATVFLLFFNLIFDAASVKPLLGDMLWLRDSLPGWGILIFLGIGPTLGGFGLYTLSLDYLPATVTNLIATLEPVLTSIWAFFLFGERLTAPQLLGGVFVFASVILLRIRE